MHLADIDLAAAEAGKASIGKQVDRMVAKKISAADAEAAMARLKPVDGIPGLSSVDFVVEAVTENEELKTKLFKQLDEVVAEGKNPRDQYIVDLYFSLGGQDIST